MSYHYRSGQPIPQNVTDMIHYLAKVGTVTTKGWKRLFVKGTDRWQRALLANLLEREIIAAHSCTSVSNAWVLGSWSKMLLINEKRTYVTPVPPQQIEHDEVIGLGLTELMRTNACDLWFSERELKMNRPKELTLNFGKLGTKYPDAVLAFKNGGNVWLVALEYERSGKDRRRYESILKAYSNLDGIHQILFITEEKGTAERIKSSAGLVRETRLGFIEGEDWRKSSLLAKIIKGNQSSSFSSILKSYSEQAIPRAIP
jgi:hypothetical protein